MKRLLILFIMFCAAGNICFADTPESIREQANNKIKIANQLVADAQKLSVPGQTSQNRVVGLKLFIQAGQLFEQAENMLKTLGARYVSQSDIDSCARAAQSCANEISNIRRVLELDVSE
jgi:hypothetical protein